MRCFFAGPFVCTLALLCVVLPLAASGQSADALPDSSWNPLTTTPVTPQQHQDHVYLEECASLHRAHDYQSEVKICDHAIQDKPDDPVGYRMRASAYARLKQYDLAAADLEHGLALAGRQNRPLDTAGMMITRASVHTGRHEYAGAVQDLQAALRINPKSADACNALAWLRATAPVAAVRDGREGVRIAQQALALGTRNTHSHLDTLAAAYAESGDFAQAVACQKRAMTLAASEIADPMIARQFQTKAADRLQLYERGQPYHADLSPD